MVPHQKSEFVVLACGPVAEQQSLALQGFVRVVVLYALSAGLGRCYRAVVHFGSLLLLGVLVSI